MCVSVCVSYTHTPLLLFKKKNIYIYIYMGFFWLQWVFVAVRRLSLVMKSGDYPLVVAVVASLVLVHRLLGVQASIVVGSVVVAHGL